MNQNEFKRSNVYFSARETPGEKFPQICGLKKLGSSAVSGKTKQWLQIFIFVTWLLF